MFIRRRAFTLGFFVLGETTVNAARIFSQRPHTSRWSARPGLRRRVALGTDSKGDLTGGCGVGVEPGEDGSGTSVGATASGNNIESGGHASASCSYGTTDVGVTANSSGVSPDAAYRTPTTGECSGFVGYNG